MNNLKEKKRGGFYDIEGILYPSVTQIIGIINKPQLLRWAAREAYYATIKDPTISEETAVDAHVQSRDKAASRGATIHSLVELIQNGSDAPSTVPPPFQGYYNAFRTWFQGGKAKFLDREKTVFSKKHIYAGTLDALVEMGGKRYLVDFKTNKDGIVYAATGLQLSAYLHALEEEGIGVDGMLGIGLSEGGTYTEQTFQDDFEYFLAAYKLWKWENREKLKKLGVE